MEEINADLDKELPALIGKTIPLEVEEGLGFEVMDCKIKKIEKFRSPSRAQMTFTFSYNRLLHYSSAFQGFPHQNFF